MPCTLAAGNSGEWGFFEASDAAAGNGVTAVASFDNIVTPWLAPRAHYVESIQSPHNDYNQSTQSTFFGWVPGHPLGFGNISLPLKALSNDTSNPADACASLPDNTPDLSGSAVLIRLGGCDAAQKAKNLMAHNADQILFYANENEG